MMRMPSNGRAMPGPLGHFSWRHGAALPAWRQHAWMSPMVRRNAASSVDLIIEGPVAKVVLNRPDKLNALTIEMRQQLREYAERLRFDEQVRAIIVTGEGRAFCT